MRQVASRISEIEIERYSSPCLNESLLDFLYSTGQDCCVDSLTPDNSLFKHLASVYVAHNDDMKAGDACPPESFDGGIVNGANWYAVRGKRKM